MANEDVPRYPAHRPTPDEAGRHAARELIAALEDVEFPVERDELVRRVDGRSIEIEPGNEVEIAPYLRGAPEATFGSAKDVARRLILQGAIRYGGRDVDESVRDATPGTQGEGEGYDSAFSTEPPEGAMHQDTAPPAPPSDTKGVRRPRS